MTERDGRNGKQTNIAYNCKGQGDVECHDPPQLKGAYLI